MLKVQSSSTYLYGMRETAKGELLNTNSSHSRASVEVGLHDQRVGLFYITHACSNKAGYDRLEGSKIKQ